VADRRAQTAAPARHQGYLSVKLPGLPSFAPSLV
jgi:hypothetical protein